jgi:hypothetical protein
MKNSKSVIILWDEKDGQLIKIHEVHIPGKIYKFNKSSDYRNGFLKFSSSGNLIAVAGAKKSEI